MDFEEGNSTIIEDQNNFENIKEEISNKHPGFSSFDKEQLASLSDIQNELETDEILIKYYYYDKELFVFLIGKFDFAFEVLPASNFSQSQVDSLNQLIVRTPRDQSSGIETEYCRLAHKVYNDIFKPIEENSIFADKSKLYIIPDGPIKNVSFNALMHQASLKWSDAEDFLISKYSFSYLFYASQFLDSKESPAYDNEFVGFGIKYQDDYLRDVIKRYHENEDTIYSDGSRSISLFTLNHAVEEVEYCADLLSGKPILEKDATPTSIRSNLESSLIAHFAVHSLVDQDDYLNSYILLHSEYEEGQKFSYNDILNMNLSCDLIVLSACQSGIGQNVVGEGLMSLSRAFIQSGSKSSLGTYWNASDRSTRQIMTIFYKNLKDGLSRSEAIRSAQLEYLSNDKLSTPAFRAPYYWAGWTLYGKDGHMDLSGDSSLLIGVGILLFILLGFYIFKKRTSASIVI